MPMTRSSPIFTTPARPCAFSKLRCVSGSCSAADIFRPGSPRPDGTFALFRVDPERVEIVSDYTASRTIWFHCTSEFFIASTSQRMVVTFLRGFCPNLTAARWMLSSGSLGPHQSWDERLQPLPANTSLMLDRVRWGLRLENGPPLTFTPEHRTVQLHRRLAEAVEKSVHDLKIEPERWTLALSGGMDSRSLLYHLRGAKGLRTVTWGLRAALGKQDSDAAIARRLADQCQLPNEHVRTDDSVSFATIWWKAFSSQARAALTISMGTWMDSTCGLHCPHRGFTFFKGPVLVLHEQNVRIYALPLLSGKDSASAG